MSSNLYRKGSYLIMDLTDLNGLFELYFNLSLIEVLSNKKRAKKYASMYCYCLRRFCGLKVAEICFACGFNSVREVVELERYFVSLVNVYAENYDAEFKANFINFRKFCRQFRKPMTAKERYQKWYSKHSNKKKRK